MPWTAPAITQLAEDSSSDYRRLSFKEAIRETLYFLLESNPEVFLLGEGVDDASGIFGSTLGLSETFGKTRVVDTPLAENGMTGIAIGAAITGLRPVFIHMRCDFLLIALDQLLNHAAKWSYMSDGKVPVPLTIRAVIGRGWGSAAQHAQSIQALLTNLPGLKVVMPATAYDAKGLLLSAVADNNPVVLLEHRWLYERKGYVPAEFYSIPIGQAHICRKGKDATIIASSLMVHDAMSAAEQLEKESIDIEVIDLRTIKPLDTDAIIRSVKKTGRLVVAENGHLFGGTGAEVLAVVFEQAFAALQSAPVRIAYPESPVPASSALEQIYYPGIKEIKSAVYRCMMS